MNALRDELNQMIDFFICLDKLFPIRGQKVSQPSGQSSQSWPWDGKRDQERVLQTTMQIVSMKKVPSQKTSLPVIDCWVAQIMKKSSSGYFSVKLNWHLNFSPGGCFCFPCILMLTSTIRFMLSQQKLLLTTEVSRWFRSCTQSQDVQDGQEHTTVFLH